MFTTKRTAYQSPTTGYRVMPRSMMMATSPVPFAASTAVPIAASTAVPFAATPPAPLAATVPMAAASMASSSTMCCIIGLIVFVMLVFYCLDKKFNIRRQSMSSNMHTLRSNVNSLKQNFESQMLASNQSGAGKEDCTIGMNSNQLDDSMKVDLAMGNDCCCGDTPATHMPACGGEYSGYPRNNFMSRNGNCSCIDPKVMECLSCRGGNGCPCPLNTPTQD